MKKGTNVRYATVKSAKKTHGSGTMYDTIQIKFKFLPVNTVITLNFAYEQGLLEEVMQLCTELQTYAGFKKNSE